MRKKDSNFKQTHTRLGEIKKQNSQSKKKSFTLDYKKTIHLPKTSFPIKGDLEKIKEKILKFWKKISLYKKVLEKNKKGKFFVLHDGPPYANGDIHVGHVLNKVLKDIVNKYKAFLGYFTPYIPGWDCHGLPIEYAVIDKTGLKKEKLSTLKLRQRCSKYALKYVEIQKKQFQDLGILGDFEHPYLTLDPQYESYEIEVFLEFFKKGLVFRQNKPVLWCWHCGSALAEAEVEYKEKTSPSLYLKIPFTKNQNLLKKYVFKKYFLVWTTTPWTLPANVAFAVHPKEKYLAILVNKEIYILMKKRLHDIKKFFPKYKILKEISSKELLGKKLIHPLGQKWNSRVTEAEFVSFKEGTGIVHIAPGHGLEDFELSLKKNLPLVMPIDEEGKFTKEGGLVAGLEIEKANKKIINWLSKNHFLLKQEEIIHSYPHCWRCKNPLIFRATSQWFIKTFPLVKKAKRVLQEIKFYPPQAKKRFLAMLEARPDWCISRQRKWGVPIPSLLCKDCGEEFLDENVLKKVIRIFRKEGSDAWFSRSIENFLSPFIICPQCGGKKFKQGENILDVWFDSGTSYAAVRTIFPFLPFPSDLYLEGSDQHRGWFQSSLLAHLGGLEKAPYKAILSHGFCVDSRGEKMSKSIGNVIDPEDVKKVFGTEILRFWVSLSDFRDDVRISSPKLVKDGVPILEGFSEMHFKIRNTFRFILGNLFDFDPSKDLFSKNKIKNPIDLWILARLQEITKEVENAYKTYKFFKAMRILYNFVVFELSSLYFDIIKDRLYTWGKNSQERKATQNVLYEILFTLLPLFAPFLSYLAEEVFLAIPFKKEKESIFLLDWPKTKKEFFNKKLLKNFEELLKIRKKINEILDKKRREKKINSTLQAKVILALPAPQFTIFKKYQDILAEFFITSEVILKKSKKEKIKVLKTSFEKCFRCWKYLPDIGIDEKHPLLCQRCALTVEKND